jgi:hypothetical protein
LKSDDDDGDDDDSVRNEDVSDEDGMYIYEQT